MIKESAGKLLAQAGVCTGYTFRRQQQCLAVVLQVHPAAR